MYAIATKNYKSYRALHTHSLEGIYRGLSLPFKTNNFKFVIQGWSFKVVLVILKS